MIGGDAKIVTGDERRRGHRTAERSGPAVASPTVPLPPLLKGLAASGAMAGVGQVRVVGLVPKTMSPTKRVGRPDAAPPRGPTLGPVRASAPVVEVPRLPPA